MSVQYKLEANIAVVTLDDGKANAISPKVVSELGQALEQARGEARALVLTGREGKFSAGFDLRVMMSGPDAARDLVTAGADLLMNLYGYPKPVVMACTGHALAAGALMLATGDERIGARGAFKLGLNEVAVGLPVPILAHQLARDRLDPRHLTRSVVQAHIYDPDEAVEAGWLDQVVDVPELMSTAMSVAEGLGNLPDRAYALTKQSLRQRTIDHVRATLASDLQRISGS